MAKRTATKTRGKRDQAAKIAGDLSSLKLVGSARRKSSRVQPDTGDVIREELITQSTEDIHKLPTHMLCKVSPILAYLVGHFEGRESVFPGLPADFFESGER